ncbi:MAG: ROK family protein [Anaerolineae bacterium]|nr:ROK family protein [Anaerolineae bacterium]
MAQLAIGIDIGGTKIALALVDDRGQIVQQQRLPTEASTGPAAILDRLAQAVKALVAAAGQPVRGIGAGCPGHVDAATGVVRRAVNLGWHDVPFGEHLAAATGLPVVVDNDVRVWAAGERLAGAGRHTPDFVFLALGTGLGGAAVLNGQLVPGSNRFAMEVGHVPVLAQGRRCSCGLTDCAEMYVSGKGLLAGLAYHRAAFPHSPLAALPQATTADLLAAAAAADPLAQHILAEARQVLIQVATWCAVLLNPQRIIIGGGLAQAAPALLAGLEAAVRDRVLPPVAGVGIVPSTIQEAVVGAASLVWLAPPD